MLFRSGYQIAGIGAGISPVLFAAIMSGNGGTTTVPLSLVLALVAAVSIACILRLGETRSRSLSEPVNGSSSAVANSRSEIRTGRQNAPADPQSGSAATAVDPTTMPTAEGHDS